MWWGASGGGEGGRHASGRRCGGSGSAVCRGICAGVWLGWWRPLRRPARGRVQWPGSVWLLIFCAWYDTVDAKIVVALTILLGVGVVGNAPILGAQEGGGTVFGRCAAWAKDYWLRLRHVPDDDPPSPRPTGAKRRAGFWRSPQGERSGGCRAPAAGTRRPPLRSPCGDRQNPAAAPPAPLPPWRTPPPSPIPSPRPTPSSISTMSRFILFAAAE